MITFDAITADLNRAQDVLNDAEDGLNAADAALLTSPHNHDLRTALNAAHDAHKIARAAYIAARASLYRFINNSTP